MSQEEKFSYNDTILPSTLRTNDFSWVSHGVEISLFGLSLYLEVLLSLSFLILEENFPALQVHGFNPGFPWD